MSDSPSGDPGSPTPGRVRTRSEFAHELTLLRDGAGLTVRQVAEMAGVQGTHSTIGDWFAGRGMPSPSSTELLVKVLQVCGVGDADVLQEWLRAWRRARRAPGRRAAGPEPYRGLASFQPADAEWFFGRAGVTSQLIARISALRAAGGGVQLVVGASGSGKSSVLRAGLVPALDDSQVLLTTPTDSIAGQLAESDAVSVIVVDQFEEVFTTVTEDTPFIAELSAAASGGTVVVVGLRADFYAQALRYPQLVAAAQDSQLAIGPMNETELRAAITEPARKANLDIEDGLVELLLREIAPRSGGNGEVAHDAGALPLLSYALYATWRQGQGRRLTIANYREVGGIEGAVAAGAGAIYDELTAHQQELVRRLFLSLVHVAADTADTRRRVTRAELLAEIGDADAEDVLDRFVAQRLVTADIDTVEISHEALLTAWPQLRAWLDTDHTGLVISRRLTEAATTWRRENRDPAALYRGSRLAAAQEWADTVKPGLPPLVQDFLDTSVQAEQNEQRLARKRTRRLRRLVGLLTVLLLLAGTATFVAVQAQQAASRERNEAQSRSAAYEAAELRATNPALAAQLALAAYRLSPTTEARSSLLSTFGTPYATRLTEHTNGVASAVFSPNLHTLATTGFDGAIRLWDVTDPHHPGQPTILSGHNGVVTSAAFSTDGRTLATVGDDRTLRLWDVTDTQTPTPLTTVPGHNHGIRSVAYSPDAHTLATASYDMTARLWDISDPRHVHELAILSGYEKPVLGVAFSPDGHTLASTHGEGFARLWDVTDPRRPNPLATLTGHTSGVFSAVFSPDGRTLATTSLDDTARLWNITELQRPQPTATLAGHTGIIYSAAFDPDGHTLATASEDHTARLWDVSDPHRPRLHTVLNGHSDRVHSARFSPRGGILATASLDGTARLWDIQETGLASHATKVHAVGISADKRILATAGDDHKARLWDITNPRRPNELATLNGHTDVVTSVTISPDGHTVATVGLDDTTRLWDITEPKRPQPLTTLTGHTNNVVSVAFSSDGRTLTTASADSTVRLWEITDRQHPNLLGTAVGHTNTVNSVVFSPDNHTLATGSSDGTVRLWDIADPRHPNALTTISGHTGVVYSVAFGPDAHILATGGTDHTARLWDITDRRQPKQSTVLAGHSNTVNSITFDVDTHTLVTASTDRMARLWDITDLTHPTTLAVLAGHSNAVSSVSFSSANHTLITGSTDGTARLWDLDENRVADRICEIAYPPITQSEWDQHFPGRTYHSPC